MELNFDGYNFLSIINSGSQVECHHYRRGSHACIEIETHTTLFHSPFRRYRVYFELYCFKYLFNNNYELAISIAGKNVQNLIVILFKDTSEMPKSVVILLKSAHCYATHNHRIDSE